jgi:hypothetical protein
MKFEWNRTGDIPLTQGVNDLTYANDTYVLVSNIPSGNLDTVALSPIATSSDLTVWTVQKRINPNFKDTRLLTIGNITYYIGTEQDQVTIYSTEDNVNFTRVRKFYNFITDTSKSRVRKVGTTYVITLLGGFITYDDSGVWNIVYLSEQYKDYYVLDAAYHTTAQFLLCKDTQCALASYANNQLTYSTKPFDDATGTYYGLVNNENQLIILGSNNQLPCMIIKESRYDYAIIMIPVVDTVYENYEYSIRDGIYIDGTWVFVGVKGKYNGPDRIFITENSLIYTNSGDVTIDPNIELNSSSSVFGLDRIYHLNNNIIALGTGYPNNDKFLVISN